MYWVKSSLIAVILSSIYVSLAMLCATSVASVSVTTFPTSLRLVMIYFIFVYYSNTMKLMYFRAMAAAIGLMAGRIGSVLGNILLPTLLSYGCLPPFIFVCGMSMIACFLSFILPETKNKSLE